MREHQIPNLLLAGFQKCGSSALFDILCQHEYIQGSSPKETFALADPEYHNYSWEQSSSNPDFSWNRFYRDEKDKESSKYLLEASVSNFYQQTAQAYAKNQGTNCKVIFVLRDPIERLISTYYYYGGNGLHLEPNTSLDTYVKMSFAEEHEHEPMRYAVKHGKYYEYIQTWEKLLGKEAIHLISMKKLIRDTQLELDKLFVFLKLSPIIAMSLPHKNKTYVHRFPNLHIFLVNRIRGKFANSKMLRSFYRKMTSKNPDKAVLSDALKKQLKHYYQEEYHHYGDHF